MPMVRRYFYVGVRGTDDVGTSETVGTWDKELTGVSQKQTGFPSIITFADPAACMPIKGVARTERNSRVCRSSRKTTRQTPKRLLIFQRPSLSRRRAKERVTLVNERGGTDLAVGR